MGKKEKSTARTLQLAAWVALLLGVLAACFVWRRPLGAILTDEAARSAFVDRLQAAGPGGFFLFLGLQVLQILVAVIPGEPVEVLAGVLYGTVGGTLACLAGIFVGSALIYWFVKCLGADPFSAPKYQKYRFLQEPKRAQTLLFILYLIPGTPKDMLLYIAPFLPVRPGAFFAICTLARIPTVVSSAFAGANLAEGDWRMMALVFAACTLLGLWGIWYNERFLAACSRRFHRRPPAQKE